MRKSIETLKNIWNIEDLRQRILITILFVAIYRFGSYVVLPGINPDMLSKLHEQTSEGLLALLNMFSGGAFSNASIFALGIMPYISASIVIQLLAIAVPYFQKLQREGESGRRKINQYTRILTIFILIFQAPSYLINLKMQAGPALNASLDWTFFIITSTIILAAGSMFILWLGERITDKGIGNGISLIIMIGIIARLPQAFSGEFVSRLASPGAGGIIMFLLEIVMLILVIAAAILLVQGVRKVPVQYAKRIVGNKQYGGARQYIPLKVNAANVMPIIFAQAIMFIPITIVGFSNVASASGIARAFVDHTSFWYNLVFAILIIVFTWFYTAITINPTQMAEDMKRNNGFIPGIKPGKSTADYIDTIMSRITLPGSLFLAIVAILPAFAGVFGVQAEFAQFFGGTSLLILVGVVLDTLQQVESHLLMRHYDGLHADQIQGFFNIPVDHLYASAVFLPYIQSLQLENLVIATPDVGGSKRASTFSKYLGVPLVLCNKSREKANEVASMQIIGDVEGKNVVLIDDIVDTAGTITKAANIMLDAGAKSVRAIASHCVMSDPASFRVQESALTEMVFTDSIPYAKKCAKVKQLSIADMFAETIKRVMNNESISLQYII